VVERAIALGETDPFDFVLARDLGRTLDEIRQLPEAEVVSWRAFYRWEKAMVEYAHNVQAARRGRR
jgi:hypothetical protein